MRSFTYRLLSLALRFGCPLVILYLSNPDLLGEYYLFTTSFTLLVFLISLEISIVFSSRHLRSHSETGRGLLFNELVATQALLALLLATPVLIGYALLSGMRPAVALFLLSFVATEACVNEVGRFFWNVGRSAEASVRDLLRAVAFSAAVIASVVLDGAIVTVTLLASLTLFNAVLLGFELRTWGKPSWPNRFSVGFACSARRIKRLRKLLLAAKSQILHVQVLSILPLIERASLEHGGGLALVGSYSLQYALVQSGASLVMLPRVAIVRQAILSVRNESNRQHAGQASSRFVTTVVLYNGLSSLVAYLILPQITHVLGKTLIMTPLMIFIVFLSACATNYASTVSPLFAAEGRIKMANGVTLACMAPVAASWLYLSQANSGSMAIALLGIGLTAALQLACRLRHSLNVAGMMR